MVDRAAAKDLSPAGDADEKQEGSVNSLTWARPLLRGLSWPVRWFAAHDVFISYSRRDSKRYAFALANALGALKPPCSCAIDWLESRPGAVTPPPVLRHARWSRARIVLATPESLASGEINRELAQFASYPAPVVVIAEPGVVIARAPWHRHLVGVTPVLESGGREAFEQGWPSDEVLRASLEVLIFMRRERRIMLGAALGAALAALGLAAALTFGQAASAANKARLKAEIMAGEASDAASAARGRASMAEGRAASANQLAAIADEQAASASAAATAAGKRAALANAAAASATQQALSQSARALQAGRRSEATTLALEAADMIRTAPSRTLDMLDLARRSVAMAPTAAGDAVLRRALAVVPPLLGEWPLGCGGRIAAFDAVHKLLATEGGGQVCVLDLRGLKPIKPFEIRGSVNVMRFVEGGRLLMVTSRLGTFGAQLRILHPAKEWQLEATADLKTDVGSLAVHPSGRAIAIGGRNGRFGLVTRQADGSWIESRRLELAQNDPVDDLLKFDPSGRFLFVGNRRLIEVWSDLDGPSPHRIWHTRLSSGDVPIPAKTPLLFDPTGPTAIGAWGNAIRVFRLPDMEVLQTLPIANVDALFLSPSGDLIAHTSDTRFLTWFRDEKGQFRLPIGARSLAGRLPGGLWAGELATSTDGKHLWAFETHGDEDASWASLLHIASGEEIARVGHDSLIRHLFRLADGGVVSLDDKVARLWGDIQARNVGTRHGVDGFVSAVVDESATRAAVVVGGSRVQIWNLQRPPSLANEFQSKALLSLAFSGDGTKLEVIADDQWLRAPLSPFAEPTPQLRLPPPGGCNRLVAWSTDSTGPVVGTGGRTVWIANESAWTRRELSIGRNVCFAAMAIDSARRQLAVSYEAPKPSVAIFDVDSGRRLSAEIETPQIARSLAFDASGRRLLIGGMPNVGRVQLISSPTGEAIATHEFVTGNFFSAACISPDGQMVAAEGGRLARVWRIEEALRTMVPLTSQALPERAGYCSFARDGRRVAFTDGYGLRVMDLSVEDMLAEAERRLPTKYRR